MVTIKELLPYSYWIGHPVSNRAIVYLFVGFTPLTLETLHTLNYIILLNTKRWAPRSPHSDPARMRIPTQPRKAPL
uniref:ORF2p protein n=1 Tax=Human enterovirus 71 (strain USA/BrCr/1970) TaxID=69153 RepID=ORF2P_HE71B|nr:RecName: Full=ORF2p protein [Human enterovirus 71 (strain BRCR)]